MRPLYLLALAAAAAALQFSPVKPLRRRALQRRIRREADFISSPARGMDPEVLIQDDDALDDLVRKHNNLVEELRNLDEPARPRSTAAVAGPNAHRVPIHKVEPRKAVRKFMKMPPAKKAAAVGAAGAALCGNQNFTARSCSIFASSSTPSTRRLLDSVVMLVPHRSTEPGRPRHRRAPVALVDFTQANAHRRGPSINTTVSGGSITASPTFSILLMR